MSHYSDQMDDTLDDPDKGTFSLNACLMLPDTTKPMYNRLHHDLVARDVFALDMSCTRAEAEKLTERVRAANPGLAIKAKWVGGVKL